MKIVIPLLRSLLAAGVLAAYPQVGFGAVGSNAPAPELSITLCGLLEDSLEQGEALRVTVRLESSGEDDGRVELAPASGTWVDAVAVELLAASGRVVTAQATAVGAPESPHATLDRERVAGGMWMFPASATQPLALGDYTVRARLNVQGGTGWTGEVASEEVPLHLVAVSDDSTRVSARTFERAQIALSQGSAEQAARTLDAVLANTPDEFELLCLRAKAALAGGNPLAAAICVARAARLLAPQNPGPPPQILQDAQQRVASAQFVADAPQGSVPDWTWPPASVLKLSEKDAAELLAKSGSAPPAASARVVPAATARAVSSMPATNAPPPTAPRTVAPSGMAEPKTLPMVAIASSLGTIVPAVNLADAKVSADPAGQWATGATAGSQYGRTQYSAAKATGAPDIKVAGNSPDAWCPENKDRGSDWLEVSFAKPAHATEVRVRQNDSIGAITRIEAIEPSGTAHVWWEGVDPCVAPATREIVWFAVRVPKTNYLVARIKITLNLAAVPGWKEIDAVQLVGTAE